MSRRRSKHCTTFIKVCKTNRKEDSHFVTPYNKSDGGFSFTLPPSISAEVWLESLKDITSKISLNKTTDTNNNETDEFEMISSAIQKMFPQLEERIPLFVAKTITSGPGSYEKKVGDVPDSVDLRLDNETGGEAFGFGSTASDKINQDWGCNDPDTVEDIIFRELISDLGDIINYNSDRDDCESRKKSLDEGDNLAWISDLDDDESDDQITKGKQVNQEIDNRVGEIGNEQRRKSIVNEKSENNKAPDELRQLNHDEDVSVEQIQQSQRLSNPGGKELEKYGANKHFHSDKSQQDGGFGGLETSSHTVLMTGSTLGIDWKVKRYDLSNGRQIDVVFKPDHEPTLDEILLILMKVVNVVFEKKFTDDIDRDQVKISLQPQGLDPVTISIVCPRLLNLADFMEILRSKLELSKGISLHFGITLRFSKAQEDDKVMFKKVMRFVETKQSIIRVRNDDFMGLVRSIILGMYHPSRENHPYWSTLRKGGLGHPSHRLNHLSKELHMMSGVPIKKHYSKADFEALQKVLPAKYRLVILGDPWSREIYFAGPHAQTNIYVFKFDDLYFAVIKAAGFYSASYFCEKCLKRYEYYHVCKEKDL